MKQFIFDVPVKVYTTQTASIYAETEEEAWKMLRNREGDYFDTNEIDAEPDFSHAEIVEVYLDVEEVTE